MRQFPRSEAAIAGIGCTEFSKDSGVSVFNLATRAVTAAVEDAGLQMNNIDGLATFGPNDSIGPNFLAPALGMKNLNFYLNQFLGGSVSMSVIGQSALAVSAGVAEDRGSD
jgi:acetyl-CoA acetyltransferase